MGDDEAGQLTPALCGGRLYSVVLFDEIEKAHSDVFNVLLQVLDDGRRPIPRAAMVDFKNTVPTMTSIHGASQLATAVTESEDGFAEATERVMGSYARAFLPRVLNRIDDVVVFHPLGEQATQVIDLGAWRTWRSCWPTARSPSTRRPPRARRPSRPGTTARMASVSLKRAIQRLAGPAGDEDPRRERARRPCRWWTPGAVGLTFNVGEAAVHAAR